MIDLDIGHGFSKNQNQNKNCIRHHDFPNLKLGLGASVVDPFSLCSSSAGCPRRSCWSPVLCNGTHSFMNGNLADNETCLKAALLHPFLRGFTVHLQFLNVLPTKLRKPGKFFRTPCKSGLNRPNGQNWARRCPTCKKDFPETEGNFLGKSLTVIPMHHPDGQLMGALPHRIFFPRDRSCSCQSFFIS